MHRFIASNEKVNILENLCSNRTTNNTLFWKTVRHYLLKKCIEKFKVNSLVKGEFVTDDSKTADTFTTPCVKLYKH